MNRCPFSPAEIAAFNAGVRAVLDLAARSAQAIGATSTRQLAEGFAIAALEELAEAGRDLLIAENEKALAA